MSSWLTVLYNFNIFLLIQKLFKLFFFYSGTRLIPTQKSYISISIELYDIFKPVVLKWPQYTLVLVLLRLAISSFQSELNFFPSNGGPHHNRFELSLKDTQILLNNVYFSFCFKCFCNVALMHKYMPTHGESMINGNEQLYQKKVLKPPPLHI